MNRYVHMHALAGSKFCSLTILEPRDREPSLIQGVKLEPWPANAAFHMDPNFKKQTALPDCVKNLRSGIVVSKRLKDFLVGRAQPCVEYLPVSIVDHNSKIASTEYFIVNPYPLEDCIDRRASDLNWHSSLPDKITGCTKMVIDETRITPGAKILRLKCYATEVLFARDLADDVESSGFIGIGFEELEEMC